MILFQLKFSVWFEVGCAFAYVLHCGLVVEKK